jgi:hypothetical protein
VSSPFSWDSTISAARSRSLTLVVCDPRANTWNAIVPPMS